MAPNQPNMTMTPFTEEMENELLEKQNEIDAGRGVEDVGNQGAADAGAEQVRVEPEAEERPKPVQASPQDIKRAAIAARFKADGNDQTKDSPFDGDLTRQENLYGAAAAETLQPEPDAGADVIGEVQPAPQPAAKRKLVIRGQTVEMTEDEILAAAQKTLAGDSYLDEARKLLDEAKTIKAERTGRDPQHPEGRSSTQDDGLDTDPANRSQHPEDDLEAVVDQLQFGDRKEAAKLLKGAIQKEAGKIADEGHMTRLFNNDLARSQKTLADFEAANPDLANDPKVYAVISQEMMDLYREDIVKLGVVDEAQIPTDPKALANWHRWYKISGHAVRSTPDLLNKAKENFVAWRGASPKPNPQPRREQPAPRVQVNVDRDARRQAIPLQPSRAVAPRRDAVLNPPKSTDSDVVKQMRRARGQPVAG